jgi:hypothetical protein
MNAKFRKELISDLEKSGFRSEMVAIRTCLTGKWSCKGGNAYFDGTRRKLVRLICMRIINDRWRFFPD